MGGEGRLRRERRCQVDVQREEFSQTTGGKNRFIGDDVKIFRTKFVISGIVNVPLPIKRVKKSGNLSLLTPWCNE